MSNFFKTSWSDRGPVERFMILGAGIGGTIFLLVKGKEILENIKNKKKELEITKDIKGTGKKLSYPESQYQVFADTLYISMDGAGTYEEQVAGVMYKMKNDADVLKLIQKFGTKDGYSLTEWINGDFDEENKNFYVNQILAKKGITIRF